MGNHQNADSPQRVYTLWGKSVKRVSCGGKPHILSSSCSVGGVVFVKHAVPGELIRVDPVRTAFRKCSMVACVK